MPANPCKESRVSLTGIIRRGARLCGSKSTLPVHSVDAFAARFWSLKPTITLSFAPDRGFRRPQREGWWHEETRAAWRVGASG
jgi:hypothetical protein